ncbi:trichohyalin-like isoform X3 [Littorina saxatilis]
MSVWSRSHSDLARLAKTIQDHNDRTRLALTQRNGEVTKTVNRARSLSPGALLPSNGNTDCGPSPQRSGPERANNKSGQRLSCTGLSRSVSDCITNGIISDGESVNSVSSLQRTPRLTVTSAEGEESCHSDVLFDSAASEFSEVFITSPTTPVLEQTPDSDVAASPKGSLVSPTLVNGHMSSHAKTHAQKFTFSNIRNGASASTTTNHAPPSKNRSASGIVKKAKTEDENASISTNESKTAEQDDSVQTKSAPNNSLINIDPTLKRTRQIPKISITVQDISNPSSPAPDAISSPRLSSRSPDLLKKLKEVTFSISANKKDSAVKERPSEGPGSSLSSFQEGSPDLKEKEQTRLLSDTDDVPLAHDDKERTGSQEKVDMLVSTKCEVPFSCDNDGSSVSVSSEKRLDSTVHTDFRPNNNQLDVTVTDSTVHTDFRPNNNQLDVTVTDSTVHTDFRPNNNQLDVTVTDSTVHTDFRPNNNQLDVTVTDSTVHTDFRPNNNQLDVTVTDLCQSGESDVSSSVNDDEKKETVLTTDSTENENKGNEEAEQKARSEESDNPTNLNKAASEQNDHHIQTNGKIEKPFCVDSVDSPVLPATSAAMPVVTAEHSATDSSVSVSPVLHLHPSQLRVHDIDLRLVPLSAIGIVVGANGSHFDFAHSKPSILATQNLQRLSQVNTSVVVAEDERQERAVSGAGACEAPLVTGLPSTQQQTDSSVNETQRLTLTLTNLPQHTEPPECDEVTLDQHEVTSSPVGQGAATAAQSSNISSSSIAGTSRSLSDTRGDTVPEPSSDTAEPHPANDTAVPDSHDSTTRPDTHVSMTMHNSHSDTPVPHHDDVTIASHSCHKSESVRNEKETPHAHCNAPVPSDEHCTPTPLHPTKTDAADSEVTKNHQSTSTKKTQSVQTSETREIGEGNIASPTSEQQTVAVQADCKMVPSDVTSSSSENKSVGSTSSGIEADFVGSSRLPQHPGTPRELETEHEGGEDTSVGETSLVQGSSPSRDVSNNGAAASYKDSDHSVLSDSSRCSHHTEGKGTVVFSEDPSSSLNESMETQSEFNSRTNSRLDRFSDTSRTVRRNPYRRPRSRTPSLGHSDDRSRRPLLRESQSSPRLPRGDEASSRPSFKVARPSGRQRQSLCSEDSLCQSVTVERSVSYVSGSESEKSLVSASVQVSLSGASETRNRSSRSHKRSTRTKEEKHGKKSVDVHTQSHASISSSSFDSLLSGSEDGSASGYSSDVVNYLTSSSHRQGQRPVSKRRLRKLLRVLRHPERSASHEAAVVSPFDSTVADLQHLCVSLSRNLEQHEQQQLIEQRQQQLRAQQQLLQERSAQEERAAQKEEEQRARETHRLAQQQRFREVRLQELYRQQQLQVRFQQQQQQFLLQQQEQQQVRQQQEAPPPALPGENQQRPKSNEKVEAEKQTESKEELQSKLPFRLRLLNPSPQKRAADIRKLRRSSDTTPSKSPDLALPPRKKTCLFHNLPESAADLNQALIEEACKNTELLDRLGVDREVFSPAPQTRSSDGKKGRPDREQPDSSERGLKEKEEKALTEEEDKEEENRGEGVGKKKEGGKQREESTEGEREEGDEDRVTMETPEEAVFKLDDEFDKTLVDMKPHVLKLPHKSDRQKCAVWIKKLCEPPSSGITGRKNRNMHAQLMLHMLKRGSIQPPFDSKPGDGPLTPLPSYMSVYFDDPLDTPDGDADKLPDWVEGELGETVGSSLFRRSDGTGNPAATSTWVSNAGSSLHGTRQRPHTSMGIPLDKDPGLSPIRGDHRQYTGYSAHSDVELSRPLGVTGYSSTTSFGKGTMFHDETSLAKPSDKEIALRTKMIEAKFHEEKLRLQQKHDAAVQKILDRKNSEIEDVKNHYRSKSKEYEETITKLERKVQTLVKEAGVVRETKDKQIAELRKMVEDSGDTQRNEYDRRMHDMEAEFEQQKFELQKLHTRNIQEILDDTNARLQRMEAEYNQQAASTTNIIKELESRVQQLTGEVDRTLSQRSMLEKEKAELQSTVDRLMSDLEDQRHRNDRLERDHQKKLEASEHEMRTLRNKTEASLEFLKQEQNIAAAKATDTIADLEQQVEYLKKALKDAEEQRQRQMRETEQVHQQDKHHLENLHDKQVRSMKKELEQLEQEMQRKLSRLEHVVQEKDTELKKQKDASREQASQADKALEEFKQQVDKNQTHIYADMKRQMDQVETDLKKSKQAREKQGREFARQLEDQRYKHEHELQELRMTLENEKSQVLHETHVQKECLTSEHEREMEQLRETHRNELKALEFRYKERQEKDAKLSGELEAQVVELREELVQANQLRKQQLVELGLLREEEKQKMQRDHEAEFARLRTDAEQQRLELQKTHSAETERLLEKTNDRLKNIEREYMEKGKKSSETISELHNAIKHLRDDIKRAKENAEARVTEIRSQAEEEKSSLKKQYSSNLAMMQHELESQRTRCHNLERQIHKIESDHEEKTTRLKLEQEDRLRGMLPGEMKQELEDTISSLHSQVNTLQQRSAMLQEELDLRLKNPLGQFGSRTSSPIKSSV